MITRLRDAGYRLDDHTEVWSHRDYLSLPYSDGNEVEERIATIINNASDLSVFSTELHNAITDWPSLYHLSGTRANLLRPLSCHISSQAQILEIGAGCGAITRYLGESGAMVVALEGSKRRAEIARARTRDLPNVYVVAEELSKLSLEVKFDVVTLIGVLEYASVYASTASPAVDVLTLAARFLKPGGKLILAIENQLGLKYFAGAPEDHIGSPMYGIEGRYRKGEPSTFGRRTLIEFLVAAGFQHLNTLIPLPDYKLPVSVLTETALDEPHFDAASFAWQSARRDPQLPASSNISLELAWDAVFRNGLALDLANSFLIVASLTSQSRPSDNVLAYHYSTNRIPAYCKETVFTRRLEHDRSVIDVVCRPLAPDSSESGTNDASLIQFAPKDRLEYTQGVILSKRFIEIVTRPGWSFQDVSKYLDEYIQLVRLLLAREGFTRAVSGSNDPVPGHFFDAVPHNIIVRDDGIPVLIDVEWSLPNELSLGYLLFRALNTLFAPVTRFASCLDCDFLTYLEFIKIAFSTSGFPASDELLESYLRLDSAYQEQITGRPQTDALRNGLQQRLPMATPSLLELEVKRLRGDIATLLAKADKDNHEIEALHSEISKLQATVAERNLQVTAIYASTSWRLTRPFRGIKKALASPQFARIAAIHYATRAWHALPQPAKNAVMPALLPAIRAAKRYQLKKTLERDGSDSFVPLLQSSPLADPPARLICFHLPQFHAIPENDAWWGAGFTEWSNIRPAKPQFPHHYQPRIPGELGYYNLLDDAVLQRQIELARLYGIYGFCFYFYWFAGKRLLETPVLNFLSSRNLDFPFCLCWANENWTRRWDGLDHEVLISQQHSAEDDIAFISHVAVYMRDRRYIRIGGRPLVIVYRPSLLPDAHATANRWREWCRTSGIGEIHLAYTQSFESVDPLTYGFDAAIEFPPNNSNPPDLTDRIKTPESFDGRIYDMTALAERSDHYSPTDYTLYRGVCPSWDNTPRRKNRANIFANSTPRLYQEWLTNAINDSCKRESPDERLVFINAWNEWAEGAYLEPDERYGYAYLEATRMAQIRCRPRGFLDLNLPIAVVIHCFYLDLLDEILSYVRALHSTKVKLYVTTTSDLAQRVTETLGGQPHDFVVVPVENRGRDVLPFFKIMPLVQRNGHQLVIKVHTKRSPHRADGARWRREMLDALLTDSSISQSLRQLVQDSEIGILGPANHVIPMSSYFGSNAKRVNTISQRMGIADSAIAGMSFVAGTMFMARMDALFPLLNLALGDQDFEEERGQLDGTLAHAIERLFSVSAIAQGYKVRAMQGEVVDHYRYAAQC